MDEEWERMKIKVRCDDFFSAADDDDGGGKLITQSTRKSIQSPRLLPFFSANNIGLVTSTRPTMEFLGATEASSSSYFSLESLPSKTWHRRNRKISRET